jgi:hypothetical protein
MPRERELSSLYQIVDFESIDGMIEKQTSSDRIDRRINAMAEIPQ